MQDFRKIGSQLVFRIDGGGGSRRSRCMTHDREFGRRIIAPTVPLASRLAANHLPLVFAYILPRAALDLHVSAMLSFCHSENGVVRSVKAESVSTPLGFSLA